MKIIQGCRQFPITFSLLSEFTTIVLASFLHVGKMTRILFLMEWMKYTRSIKYFGYNVKKLDTVSKPQNR